MTARIMRVEGNLYRFAAPHEAESGAQAQARGLLALAFNAKREGRLDDAIDLCEQAIGIWPSYTKAWIAMGEAWFRQKEFILAEGCFNEALSLEPENPLIHASLAALYGETGRWVKAVRFFRRLLGRPTSSNDPRRALGAIKEVRDRHANLTNIHSKDGTAHP